MTEENGVTLMECGGSLQLNRLNLLRELLSISEYMDKDLMNQTQSTSLLH